MTQSPFHYQPNPAHKLATSEAGPPAWYPKKTPCPDDLSIQERDELVEKSFSESGDSADPDRWTVKRLENSSLQWFCIRSSNMVLPDGRKVIHGFPFEPGYPKVPPSVLRQMRDHGVITRPEYKKMVKA